MKIIEIDDSIIYVRHWFRWYVAYVPYGRDSWEPLSAPTSKDKE